MKFDVSDIKRKILHCLNNPKRNVVHTIGYNKFSPKEILRKTRLFITDYENKKRVKKVIKGVKRFTNKVNFKNKGIH